MFAQPGCDQSELLGDAGERLATLPILVLNVHTRCNCRCVMCDIWKRSQTQELGVADLERHRESLRRLAVECVVLTGGEPLMHGDLHGLCTFFRDLGIRLTLLTTGTLLSRRAADVTALFDDVIVSLDGPREIHDAIRRVKGCFDLIGGGVAAIRSLRPEMRITARTTVQKMNHAALLETIGSANALGLDGISFLAADLTSEAFNRPLIWPGQRQDEIALVESEVEALQAEIERMITWCGNKANAGFVAESPVKLRKIVQHFRAHLGIVRFEAPRCNAPWVSAVIEVDGSVRPCFFHPAMGSLQQQTLEEIVNGDAARAFRRQLDMQAHPICQQCVCSLYRTPR